MKARRDNGYCFNDNLIDELMNLRIDDGFPHSLTPSLIHQRMNSLIRTRCIIAILLLLFFGFVHAEAGTPGLQPVVMQQDHGDVFVTKNRIAYLEDSTCHLSFEEVRGSDRFRVNHQRQLGNVHIRSTYWLHFWVHNRSDNPHFRIELYDFDINEVSVFLPTVDGRYHQESSGYSKPFSARKVKHKNPGFDMHITAGDSQEVYLRIKSNQINSLKPVIRPYHRFVEYGLKEYWLLGIFNGLMLLMLLYNFIYFILLRAMHFLYYVLYGFGMFVYLNTTNGIGFQFFWPDYPEINPLLRGLALSFSIVFLLLFSQSYLEIKDRNKGAYQVTQWAIALKLLICVLQEFIAFPVLFTWIDFLFFQFVLCLWLVLFKPDYSKIKWHLASFAALNLGVFITSCEYYEWIGSSVFTVYALNMGVILQFIFLSIGLAESIRDSYIERNKVLTELLIMREKNESLRLTELKQQMNPHFLFNALNSIQSRILSDKKEEAAKFLISFSKLIRKNLEISDQDYILLSEELKNTELYLRIERMRLGDSFHYQIAVDETLKTEYTLIPTFLLQPLIENAIWHGLMPLEGEKNLQIDVTIRQKQMIIGIKDNGIGRKNAAKLKGKKFGHRSKGLKILAERLELIGKKSKKHISLELFDLNEGIQTGTHAQLTIEL